MSPSDKSLVEEEGVNVDLADQDGIGRVGAVEFVCRDLNCASLCFTVAGIYGTNMSEVVGYKKRDEKMV